MATYNVMLFDASNPFAVRRRDITAISFAPSGGGGLQVIFVNKVWDPGGPAWVYWETSTPDSTGASYPDPYATGFGGCSGYRVAGEKQV